MSCQKETPQTPKRKTLWCFNIPGSACYSVVRHIYVGIPKIHARLGCHCLTARTTSPTNNPRKRSGAKRRCAKKTAPQSRKVYGIPTYLRRTAKIKLIPGILNHPKRLSFRGLGDFLWPRPKKAPQEFRGGLSPRTPRGVDLSNLPISSR